MQTIISCTVILHLLPIILLASLAYEAVASVAKPGCPEKCGNLTIPYPFGIGKGCFLDEVFEIVCNASSHSATPSCSGFEVNEIAKDYVSIQGNPIPFYYNKTSGQSLFKGPVGAGGSGNYFRFSATKNKFVSIGCDIYAYITDSKTDEFISGCPSLCNNSQISRIASSSSCSGNGCCQATIPKDLNNITLWANTMNTGGRFWKSDICSFSMVVEKDFNDFSMFNRSRCDDCYNIQLPIVFDWGIGNISCQEAEKRRDYACGQNTECINSARGIGYLCSCLQGYQGNPYLPNGCKDINECENRGMLCPKKAICVNTPGSYFCTCPRGYHSSSSSDPSGQACLPDRSNRSMVIFICLGVGLAIGLAVIAAACIWLHQKHKKMEENKTRKRFFKRNGGLLLRKQLSSSKGNLSETKIFKVGELEKATDNFNESRVLGKGGLGTVYKGMLSDGTIVAVKKSNKIDQDQVSQFINEVLILSQINHRHVVKLFGCCLETEVPLLVYEYVSNGTLSHHLHDGDDCTVVLSWDNRLVIATEIAGALAYLHSYATAAIFHRDIKSSNILLDENYRAVVSDFGLSRSVPIDKTHVTTVVGGTIGYLDPEYFNSGQLNDKSDVYSFGVVLAELVTGQKPIPSSQSDAGLVINFRTSIKENRLFEIVAKIVTDQGKEEEIVAAANLAKRCLKINARKRPSMKEIAAELEQLQRIRKRPLGTESFPDGYCSVSERSYNYNIDLGIENDQELY